MHLHPEKFSISSHADSNVDIHWQVLFSSNLENPPPYESHSEGMMGENDDDDEKSGPLAHMLRILTAVFAMSK